MKPGRPSFRPHINNGSRVRLKPAKDYNARRDWYGDNWEQISASIRKRDDYRCQGNKLDIRLRCNARFPPPFHGVLHVHHIIELPRGTNHPTNLITLCRVCHGKIHGKNLGTISEKQRRAAARKG